VSKIFQPLWSIISFSANFTISLVSFIVSFHCVFTLCRSQKVDRVPEYNKYCLSVHPPPFSIKGAERSVEEKESRARRNYFLRFAWRANIPGKRRFNIALPHENSPREPTGRERERENENRHVGRRTAKKLAQKKEEKKKREGGEEWVDTEKQKLKSMIAFSCTFLRSTCVLRGKTATVADVYR